MNRSLYIASASRGNVGANQHIAQYDLQPELDKLQQLFNNGKLALAADQFQDAHDTFDRLQDHIENTILPACLALRAYTCQRQQSYQEGLDIANEYTTKKSQDVDAYLLSANMYLLNNQWDAALKVYRRGVNHCDKQHPQYNNLVKCKDGLEADIKRHNMQLIQLLPGEVIDRTLSYLRREDLYTLAKTCRVWYTLVMNWPGFWREFAVNTFYHTRAYTRFLQRAPAQHVRKLECSIGEDFAHMSQHTFDMIADLKWNWLEELVITCSNEIDGTYHSPAEIIHNCKNTLKKLHLSYDQGQQLSYCLEICPNLECLIYDDYYDFNDDDYEMLEELERVPLPPGPYQLRQLAVRCHSIDLDIPDFISRCPHLESFHLHYSRCPDFMYGLEFIIPALLEHCPNLHTVEISSAPVTSKVSWVPAKGQHDIRCGSFLRKLTFNAESTARTLNALNMMIDKSKTSLEKLELGNLQSGPMLFQSLITTQIVNLRELSCHFEADQTTIAQLKALIELSPRLERVFIHRFGTSDAVLSALGQLSNLIELRFCADNPVTDDGLASLLSQSPSLQEIDLHHNYQRSYLSMYEIIQALAACRSLQKLHLSSDAWDQLTEARAVQLEREVQSNQSGLQQATLLCFGGLGKSSLRLWSGFKQLRRLEIKEQNARIIPWAQVQERINRELNIPNLRIYWKRYSESRTFLLNSDGLCTSDMN